MQDDEKKHEEAEAEFNLQAQVTINKGYTLPLAKLSVSGTIQANDDADASDKVVQRSVLFLIDRSGSMVCMMPLFFV